ncbi:MAG: glycosyltransferase involved in cell wall biosynthesis [Parvicella sp.]
MQISIVIPLFNEEESLSELTAWIDKVCTENNFTYEALLIDDGSTDKSWEVIQSLSANNPNIKGISFRRNYGKSAALNVGFEHAQGKVVITMDADLQDSPDEIPELYSMITEEGFHIVSGWKKDRKDPITKTVPTKLFNWATRKMSGIDLKDFNCGLKAYSCEVTNAIEVYGEMHRYIPVIAKWAGFTKIGQKVVQHQERKYGVTKFGLERFVNGFLDLFSITFIGKFGKRPMHFFGLLGTIMFMIGFGLFLGIAIDKLFIDTKGILLAARTSFYIALTVMIIGVQMFLAGFLGEMLARNNPQRNVYLIKEKSNLVDGA